MLKFELGLQQDSFGLFCWLFSEFVGPEAEKRLLWVAREKELYCYRSCMLPSTVKLPNVA